MIWTREGEGWRADFNGGYVTILPHETLWCLRIMYHVPMDFRKTHHLRPVNYKKMRPDEEADWARARRLVEENLQRRGLIDAKGPAE
jgi:hypothetical protein